LVESGRNCLPGSGKKVWLGKKSGQIIGRHCLQFLNLFFASIPVNLWQGTYSKDDQYFLVLLQAFVYDQFLLLISKAKLSRSFTMHGNAQKVNFLANVTILIDSSCVNN
jgi:hypothetical protein